MEPNTIGVWSDDPYYRYTGETVVTMCFNPTLNGGVCHHDDLCENHRQTESSVGADEGLACTQDTKKKTRKNKKRKRKQDDGFTDTAENDTRMGKGLSSSFSDTTTESRENNSAKDVYPPLRLIMVEESEKVEPKSKKRVSTKKIQEEKDIPLLARKPLPASPPLSPQPPSPPTRKSKSASATQSLFPLVFYVLLLIWSGDAGYTCEKSAGLSNQIVDGSLGYMYAGTSMALDLRDENQWRYITGSIDIRNIVWADDMLRRTMREGPVKTKIQILYDAANSDIISTQKFNPVSGRFDILEAQNVVHNVMSDPEESNFINLCYSRLLMDPQEVLTDHLVDLLSLVMDPLLDLQTFAINALMNLQSVIMDALTNLSSQIEKFAETNLRSNGIIGNKTSVEAYNHGLGTTNLVILYYPVDNMELTVELNVVELNTSALDKSPGLSLDNVLRMGDRAIGELKEYNLRTFDPKGAGGKGYWKSSGSLMLKIEDQTFAEGHFRDVYEATTGDGKRYVVKKYKKKFKHQISKKFGRGLEEQAKINVQVNEIASAYLKQFCKKCPTKYTNMRYLPVYLSVTEHEPIFIEEFIENGRKFHKYVNNDGALSTTRTIHDLEEQEVCESFVHYTLEQNKNELMVCDIQGWFPVLNDPEIATREEVSEDGNYLFNLGNLHSKAIDKFLEHHSCKDICNSYLK